MHLWCIPTWRSVHLWSGRLWWLFTAVINRLWHLIWAEDVDRWTGREANCLSCTAAVFCALIVSAIASGCDETIVLFFMFGHCGEGCSCLLAKDSTEVCHVRQIRWMLPLHTLNFVPWTLHVYGQTALKTRTSLCVPPSFLHSLTSHSNNIIAILHSHLLHTIIVQLSVGERSQGFNFLPPLFFFPHSWHNYFCYFSSELSATKSTFSRRLHEDVLLYLCNKNISPLSANSSVSLRNKHKPFWL